jgi:hypothetical protein
MCIREPIVFKSKSERDRAVSDNVVGGKIGMFFVGSTTIRIDGVVG